MPRALFLGPATDTAITTIPKEKPTMFALYRNGSEADRPHLIVQAAPGHHAIFVVHTPVHIIVDVDEPVVDRQPWVARFPIVGWRLRLDHRSFDPVIGDPNLDGRYLLLETADGKYVTSGGAVLNDLHEAVTLLVYEPWEPRRDLPAGWDAHLQLDQPPPLSEMLAELHRREAVAAVHWHATEGAVITKHEPWF